jgi:hypothetical protein
VKTLAKDIQEIREYLVLLLLGTSDSGGHSMLQIQKEFFYLWRSSKLIKPLIKFIAHYRGPYSEGLKETIAHPMYLENLWDYSPPSSKDKLTGGFIQINNEGKSEFVKIMKKIKEKSNEDMIQLIAAMRLLHDLYDKLSSEEFLLLVYVNPDNKEFIIKSEIYDSIVNPIVKDRLLNRLKEVNPSFI